MSAWPAIYFNNGRSFSAPVVGAPDQPKGAAPENEHKRQVREKLRVDMPEPPEMDGVVVDILQAYYIASRGRQYVGMNGAPAPLSVGALNDYLTAYGERYAREEFDAVIFALDDDFRARWTESNEPKEKGWGGF